jgi:hypothetical protein
MTVDQGNGPITDNMLAAKADISQIETAEIHGLTEEEKVLSKQLVRKIDLLIMPTILIIYIMNWIDRYVVQRKICMTLLILR